MEMHCQKLVKSNFSDMVAKQIKRMILSGQLKTGERLPAEQDLAKMFGVGRTTIREAIKALSAIGLIYREKQATYVKNVSNACLEPLQNMILLKNVDIKEIFEVREVLELSLVTLAAQRHTDEDMQAIVSSHKEIMKDNITGDRAIEANFNFHLAIARSSKNTILTELVLTIVHILKEKQKETISIPGVISEIVCQHQKIIDAIKERDPLAAREAMKYHLEEARKTHKI